MSSLEMPFLIGIHDGVDGELRFAKFSIDAFIQSMPNSCFLDFSQRVK